MTRTKEMINEALYCASCITKPCQVGCPLDNDTTGFIELIKEEKYQEAYKLLSETTVLPAICGRICPHTKQCQGMCVKAVSKEPVKIGNLESFIGDMAIKNAWDIPWDKKSPKKEKVAIVGAGPAGLTCAAFLRREGYQATIYEKHNYLGGLLYHGIPEFRLPKDLLKNNLDNIVKLGIEVKLNQELGRELSLESLEKEYDAIFLAFGANISNKMYIPGEELSGVYGGNELLEDKNHPNYIDKTVIVSGGGNVAMDVSRTIKRLGAKKVYVIYRRSENEAPAEQKEIIEAKEEGIEFLFKTNILQIIGEESVRKIEVIKTELKQLENDSRPSPVNIPNTNYFIDCDYVMMAVGSTSDKKIVNSLGLELDKRGKIIIDEDGRTSKPNIFAGGDLAGTKGTVAWASRAGRNAAKAIVKYLESGK